MKQLIKNHYSTPQVDRNILQNALQIHTQKREKTSLSSILGLCILIFLGTLFCKHFVAFNISYFDISSSIYNTVGTPIIVLLSICFSLIQFIFHNILLLSALGIMYFALHIPLIGKKS